MICRCSSPAEHAARAEAEAYRSRGEEIARLNKQHEEEIRRIRVLTPDASRYEIMEVERVGPHLVMRVSFPNCAECAYEGSKVLVYLNVTEVQALRWKRIDPHFRAPPKTGWPPGEAPSPAARFPANKDGWSDALAYARGKVRS